MKKFCLVFVCAGFGSVYGLTEDTYRRFDSIRPFLASAVDMRAKLEQFSQAAIDSFGGQSVIEVADVAGRMQDMQVPGKSITFSSTQNFMKWVVEQKKTFLLIYEPGSIKSAVSIEYMKHLAEMPGFAADWYMIDSDDLQPIQKEMESVEGDNKIFDFQVVPTVVFIIDGKIWQIPDQQALVNLKYWMDRYAAQ